MNNDRARYESELLERVVPFWIEHEWVRTQAPQGPSGAR